MTTSAQAAPSATAPPSPPPTKDAVMAGIAAGQGAPMGWSHAASQVPQVAPNAAPTTSATGSRKLALTSAAPQMQTRAATTSTSSGAPLYGIDVSSYQGTVDWGSYAASGIKFAFIKATEGTSYTSPTFSNQYSGATSAGLFRGGYHFARPGSSGGSAQADYFVANGGGWTPDGRTLPGVLDIEYNPYSDGTGTCYGLSQSQMVAWVQSFSNEYRAKTGAYPIIYSTTNWWSICTGNSPALSSTNPFWIASYTGSTTSGPGALPAGVNTWTFWQYGDGAGAYSFCGAGYDCDQFNGGQSQLQALVSGTTTFPVGTHVQSRASGLGQPVGPEVSLQAFGVTGYYQSFPNGYGVINSPYGTWISNGAIYASWNPFSTGWPTADMYAVSANGISGYQQNFQQGAGARARAFWTSQYGTAWVNGSILSAYDQAGGTAQLGWPTAAMSSQTVAGVQGWVQNFQNGLALISSSYGTFASNGPVYAAWSPQKGWPTGSMTAVTGGGISGYQQSFSGGMRAFWTSQYGTAWVNGSILSAYDQAGGTAQLGWPTAAMSSQTVAGVQGWVQNFQNGLALISSSYGTFASNGPIYAAWTPSNGWPTAAMSSQTVAGVQGWVQNFQNGLALISSSYGTFASNGPVYAAWSPQKGWPTGSMTAVTGGGISGYQQSFSGGMRAFWTSQYATTWVNGSILAAYDRLGGTRTEGWPTAAMTSQTAGGVQGWVQSLQNGNALIASSYGTYISGGYILATWSPAQYGWPTADLAAAVYQGQQGWSQPFNRGAPAGPDFAFATANGAVTWYPGTP